MIEPSALDPAVMFTVVGTILGIGFLALCVFALIGYLKN